MKSNLLVRCIALAYVTFLLVFPVAAIFWRTFAHGIQPFAQALLAPNALHAMWLTLLVVGIAVPVNTIFGLLGAMALARGWLPLRGLWDALIDLPFAISPVVVGLSLLLVYGREAWFGTWLASRDIHVVFSPPGMILATIFVSLPFVVREVTPVLREVGTEQEQAAMTLGASRLQTFFRITLPAIRWGVAYGVVLTTARALGEFGAVSVIAGHVSGISQTLTLYVDDRFQAFDLSGAYAASIVLAFLALSTLLIMHALASREGHHGY